MFKKKSSGLAEKFFAQEIRDQLKGLLDQLPRDLPVYLFTDKKDPAKEVGVLRDLMAAFMELSDKIRFIEHKPSHKLAEQWKVTRTPALLFHPEIYSIRYLGVPLGEEGRTLVETLILVGTQTSQFNEQALEVVRRIDSPRQVRVFVSPSCPYCPQQAINAVRAGVQLPELVQVEIVDTSFNEDLAEKYQAYSVPQTFVGDILIAKGAQPQELFAASLEAMREQTYFIPSSDADLVETDLVIVGGGPAGLTAGIYAARSGLKTVIVEQEALGGQVATTPVVENYPGMAHIGGKNLVDIMVAHALEYVSVFAREGIREVTPGQPFEILSTLRKFKARALLLATGAKHKHLGAAGESRFAGRGVSYCSTCDGPLFKGKKVVMVGGGNSAVTEALHLAHIGADVTLVHRRDSLRAQESLIEELEHHRIPIVWNTEVKEVRGREKVEELELFNRQTQETSVFPTDGLFVSIGYTPEVELAKKLGVDMTPDGYIKHDGRHRTNIRGVYSAGDVEGGYKQIVTAAGAGAAAAMTIFEDLTHPYWKEGEKREGGQDWWTG